MPGEILPNDVRRLIDATGVGGFGYRQIGQDEEREKIAAKWPLLGATNRGLGRLAGKRTAARADAPSGGEARRIVAIVSLCGGTGRTTIAANLAHTLALRGGRVLAIDLDPQNLLSLHFALDPVERIGMGRAHLTVSEATAFIARQRTGVAILPFGLLADAELAETQARLAADPSWLRLRVEAFTPAETSFVILDVPAGRGDWTRQAVALADEVIVVLSPQPAAYASIPATETLLAEAGASANYLVNGFDGRSKLDRDLVGSLRAALPERVLPFVIQRDEIVREALLHRGSVVQEAADSQAAADFGQLADWLRARCEGNSVLALHGVRVAG